MSKILCTPKSLTPAQTAVARRRSIEINPINAVESRIISRTPIGRRGGPKRLTLLIGNRWPKSGIALSVQFLDNPAKALRKRILLHMNAWSRTANVSFDETNGVGEVRIARLDQPTSMSGYWSYIGTEILGIQEHEPTLNLEGFTMKTPESEFIRVVRHETGHTLGFEHEHMRAELVKQIDRNKAFVFYDLDQGWDKAETVAQVLTPLSKKSIMGTSEADPLSIMCYQIPAEITKNGKTILGGTDITAKDFAFAAKVYPLPEISPAKAGPDPDAAPGPTSHAPPVLAPQIDADTFHIVILDRFEPDNPGTASKEDKQKFVRVLATYGGARVTAPMRVKRDDGGEPTLFGSIIATHQRIKKYTNRESGTLPTDQQMIAFGSALFDTLFQGDIRRLYDEARSRQHGRKLDLVFTSMVPWIAEKPWEFAYDAARRSFLATEDIHFVRNVLTAIPADLIPALRGPLRILVASAQPAGFGDLSIEQEAEVIRRGFDQLIDAGMASVEVLPRATPSSIHAKLSTGTFGVVHFIGHGVFNEDTQEGALVFENDRGGELLLGERSTREIFCQRGVRLVFLNACQTGSGGRTDFNKGVAQSLVAHGLPALVANQYSVLDASATQFAQYFYWSLAQGMTIGAAAREARIAVNYSLQGEFIDWAIPVVYARDPAMVLCAKPDASIHTPAKPVQTKSRRRAARPFEVAVWDVDNVFPALTQTLEQMTGAQQHFGFELVSLSAPVDTWYLEERAEDGSPYLWAEKFAHRLARMPLELHVNVLACITRNWLRGDDYLNIYGWWPDAKGPPILIFSCAGFHDLPSKGVNADRVIANVVVSALAGYLSQLGTHDHGARDCPLAQNIQRELSNLTQTQAFDRSCRAKLLARIPTELRALETLLATFG